jgi:hypothetical protein
MFRTQSRYICSGIGRSEHRTDRSRRCRRRYIGRRQVSVFCRVVLMIDVGRRRVSDFCRIVLMIVFLGSSCSRRMLPVLPEDEGNALAARVAHCTDGLAPGSLDDWPESGERFSRFFGSFSVSFRQEDVDEDEAEKADRTVEEEGDEGTEIGVKLFERFGDDEPPEVGRHVGQGVSPASRSHRQNLGGNDPS